MITQPNYNRDLHSPVTEESVRFSRIPVKAVADSDRGSELRLTAKTHRGKLQWRLTYTSYNRVQQSDSQVPVTMLYSVVVQPKAIYLHMDNVNQSQVTRCCHAADYICNIILQFILHNIHCMVACQVLKVSADIGYSKASATQHHGTTKSYIFTHGQCQPILSSKMQSCSWLHL